MQISPVAEVQAPAKDDKEGALNNKDVAANATEVGMGSSDLVIVPSHLSCNSLVCQKMKIHCCSNSFTAEDFIAEATLVNCL